MSGKGPNYSEEDIRILEHFSEGRVDEGMRLLLSEYSGLITSITHWPRWTFNPSTREELIQDIASAVGRALPNFSRNATLKTFITRIGANRCVSRVRTWARTEAHELLYTDMSTGDDEKREVELAVDDTFDPRKEVLRNEARRLARQLLNSLGPKCREVLTLRYMEDLSYREIAERLDVTVNEVGKRIYYCKEEAFNRGRSFDLTGE